MMKRREFITLLGRADEVVVSRIFRSAPGDRQ
jgi:hypothetical protein